MIAQRSAFLKRQARGMRQKLAMSKSVLTVSDYISLNFPTLLDVPSNVAIIKKTVSSLNTDLLFHKQRIQGRRTDCTRSGLLFYKGGS